MAFEKRVSLDCDTRNLSDCDRCILRLLHQRLMQSARSISACHKDESTLSQFKQFFEEIGLLVVSIEGQIQFLIQQADHLLTKYSLSNDSRTLPELVEHWFKYQICQHKSTGNVQMTGLPLSIEQAGKRLIIRFLSDASREQYLLLLEEQELRIFTAESLELLGLTQREAEVLFWVAKDKSNPQIASILDCSKGTVRKHLEHIHRKLGVQTRTGAVVTALERLGLLQESCVTKLS